jgi:hypothetical protein
MGDGLDRDTVSATRAQWGCAVGRTRLCRPSARTAAEWILVTSVLDEDLVLVAVPVGTAGLFFPRDG